MEYSKHFYITLFINASQKVRSSNTLAEFTIELAQPIYLGSTENWEVRLSEFSCPPPTNGTLKPVSIVGDIKALIYCDLITQQFVGNDYVRCLRTFIHPSMYCDHTFQNINYVPVEKRTLQDISISIADQKGKPIPFRSGEVPTKVVLHFLRV